MKLKLISLFLVAVMVVTGFVGCGGNNAPANTQQPVATDSPEAQPGPDNTTDSPSDAGVKSFEGLQKEETDLSGELVFWSGFTGGSGEWDQSRVDMFNEMYSENGIHVTRVQKEGAGLRDGSLMAALGTSTVPDLIISDQPLEAYAFAKAGVFMPVDDVLPKVGINTGDFFPGLNDLNVIDGNMYLIPQDANVHLLYYNKELVRDAIARGFDLDVDKGPQNLDELDYWAEALSIQNDDGTWKQLGLVPWIGDGLDAFHIPFVFGASVYDTKTNELILTEEPMMKFLEWTQGYANKYAPTILNYGVGSGGVFDPSCPFYTGEVAMYFCGNWAQNAIKLTMETPMDWGVCAVPAPSYGRAKATTFGANPFAILNSCKNPELAAFFIKFLISPVIQEDNFSQWMSIPCSDAAFEEVSLTKNGNEMYALEREIANNPLNGFPGLCAISNELNDEFQTARQKIVDGADIKTTIEDLQKRMQTALDREG